MHSAHFNGSYNNDGDVLEKESCLFPCLGQTEVQSPQCPLSLRLQTFSYYHSAQFISAQFISGEFSSAQLSSAWHSSAQLSSFQESSAQHSEWKVLIFQTQL